MTTVLAIIGALWILTQPIDGLRVVKGVLAVLFFVFVFLFVLGLQS